MYVLYGLLFAIAAVLAFVFNPALAIVLIMLGGAAIFFIGSGKSLRSAKLGAGAGPSGVPTTREASYEPVDDPGSRRAS